MRIVFIDSGINSSCFHLPKLFCDFCIDKDHNMISRGESVPSTLFSHGTICAAIFHKYAPEAQIGSIAIMDEITQRAYPNDLIAALEWCADNQIEMVNMSLGSSSLRDGGEIMRAVQKLTKTGCKVIAARSNQDFYSIPACMKEVAGVRTNQYLSEGQFMENPTPWDGIDFIASSKHTLELRSGELYHTPMANSYAAPLISAYIATGKIKKQTYHLLTSFGEHVINTETIVIAVNGQIEKCIPFVSKAVRKFLESGYRAAAVSSDVLSLPEGWIPCDLSPIQFTAIQYQMKLDIVFVVTGQPQDINYDVLVATDAPDLLCYYTIGKDKVCKKIDMNTDSIYRFIIELFQ